MDSIGTPHGFAVFFGSEFTRLHMDFVILYCTEFAGLPVDLGALAIS